MTLSSKTTVPEINELDLALVGSWPLARALLVKSRTRDERTTDQRITPGHSRIASAEIRHLSALIGQLIELRNAEESDEYGILRATEPAYKRACGLLIDAAIFAALDGDRQIPQGCVSTDSEGGVRIEWVRPASSVHLAIPAPSNRAAYIYHEIGDEYATEPASPERLAHRLREIS
jgi:rubrerythrin